MMTIFYNNCILHVTRFCAYFQQWFARPSVSVGSCSCKHLIFPQSYDKDEVRCNISIIFIAGFVVFPLTLIMLAICYKMKNIGRSKVDVAIALNDQARVAEQQPVAVKDHASRGRSSM